MATRDTRKVEIVITSKEETYIGGGGQRRKKPKESQNARKEEQKKNKRIRNMAYLAGNATVQQAISMVNYEINRELTLTDNYIGQRTLNNTIQVINKVRSVATSTVQGAMVGGWVGAAIMAFVDIAGTGIDIYQNYDQESIKIKQMDAQLQFSRQRAGYSLTSGSRGENR